MVERKVLRRMRGEGKNGSEEEGRYCSKKRRIRRKGEGRMERMKELIKESGVKGRIIGEK